MTGWRGEQVLYFGDHPYSDLADVTLEHGWRTGAIINELTVSCNISLSSELSHLQKTQFTSVLSTWKTWVWGDINKNTFFYKEWLKCPEILIKNIFIVFFDCMFLFQLNTVNTFPLLSLHWSIFLQDKHIFTTCPCYLPAGRWADFWISDQGTMLYNLYIPL